MHCAVLLQTITKKIGFPVPVAGSVIKRRGKRSFAAKLDREQTAQGLWRKTTMLQSQTEVKYTPLTPVKRLATCKRMQQRPTLLGQQCWELLRPFANGFRRSCQRLTLNYF